MADRKSPREILTDYIYECNVDPEDAGKICDEYYQDLRGSVYIIVDSPLDMGSVWRTVK
jgi:hypothetical protein